MYINPRMTLCTGSEIKIYKGAFENKEHIQVENRNLRMKKNR